MNHSFKKLPNGVGVLNVEMPGYESATVCVWVKTGSRNEEDGVNGISHFLEHMVFKGSSKRPGPTDIPEAVDSIGAEFNAATSKDYTNFYIKSRLEKLDFAMDVLSDMILNPVINEAELEKEKGVIIQEIGMYNDNPMYKIGDLFENVIYENSKLGRDIIGTEEIIKSIKREDFFNYRKIHYLPQNILVSVTGGSKMDTVYPLVEKYFSKIMESKSEFSPTEHIHAQKSPKLKLLKKDIQQANFIIGFPADGRGYKDRFAQSVLTTLLGGSMSSRLVVEVREKRGLAYAIRSGLDRYQEVGYLDTFAGVDAKKATEAIKVILDQTFGLVEGVYPIKAPELQKAKDYIKGHIALAMEDTKDVNQFFSEPQLFMDKVLTPSEIFERIDKVDIDSLMREAKRLLSKEKINLAVIGPYKDQLEFEKVIN